MATDAKVKAKLDQWQDQKFGMIIHWVCMPYRESSNPEVFVMRIGLTDQLATNLMKILKNDIGD